LAREFLSTCNSAANFKSALQHHRAGDFAEAERLYRTILAENSQHADALHLLGVLAVQNDNPEVGASLIREAIALQPSVASYHNNLGTAETKLRNYPAAISSLREAVRLKANYPDPWNTLGILFHELDDIRAVDCFRNALHLRPEYVEAMSNLGRTLVATHNVKEGISLLRQTIRLRPDHIEAHWGLALALLLDGQYAEGWHEYEWRWRLKNCPFVRKNFSQPQWRGKQLQNKRLLLHPEQGLGDIIQFARFFPLLAAYGGHVILEIPFALRRLLDGIPGVTEIVTYGEKLPPYDLHCPVMSLPLALRITLDTIPEPMQFPALRNHPEKRTIIDEKSLRVGLVWAGNPKHLEDRKRSISLLQLVPLAEIPNVLFFSLAKERVPEQLVEIASQFSVTDLCSSAKDFVDTAEHIATLDLVISVDTAVAHLAATMNKPVWLLLPYTPDWRWLRDREDSPWYPSMRIFRQTRAGDWSEVIERVKNELIQLASHS
jgi:Flp pilus assembly protein TadD